MIRLEIFISINKKFLWKKNFATDNIKKNDCKVNTDENDYNFLNNKLVEIKTTIALLEKIIFK